MGNDSNILLLRTNLVLYRRGRNNLCSRRYRSPPEAKTTPRGRNSQLQQHPRRFRARKPAIAIYRHSHYRNPSLPRPMEQRDQQPNCTRPRICEERKGIFCHNNLSSDTTQHVPQATQRHGQDQMGLLPSRHPLRNLHPHNLGPSLSKPHLRRRQTHRSFLRAQHRLRHRPTTPGILEYNHLFHDITDYLPVHMGTV